MLTAIDLGHLPFRVGRCLGLLLSTQGSHTLSAVSDTTSVPLPLTPSHVPFAPDFIRF